MALSNLEPHHSQAYGISNSQKTAELKKLAYTESLYFLSFPVYAKAQGTPGLLNQLKIREWMLKVEAFDLYGVDDLLYSLNGGQNRISCRRQ